MDSKQVLGSASTCVSHICSNVTYTLQSTIPADGKILAFILYADKSKLSSFGRQKGWPVVARIANLPTRIQNGEGIGGGHVVGWLPIVRPFINLSCGSRLELKSDGFRWMMKSNAAVNHGLLISKTRYGTKPQRRFSRLSLLIRKQDAG